MDALGPDGTGLASPQGWGGAHTNERNSEMIRNLKALGLALVAVGAMGALMASSAQALTPAHLTAGSAANPATIRGVQTTANVFNRAGRTVTCETAEFNSSTTVEGSVTDLSIVPTYANCHAVVLGTKFPATVTMNSCYYTFTGTKLASGAYTVRTDLHCLIPGDEVEVHIYNGTPHSVSNEICTIDIPEQTNLTTITLTNRAGSVPHDVDANINVTNITSEETKPGILCGPAHSATASLGGGATLRAFDHASGAQVPLTVSG